VDFPKTEGPISKADQESGGIQPTITLYGESAITNWRTIKVGSRVLLSLVVLKEAHENEDGFGVEIETQYRVLRLEVVDTNEGPKRVYKQEIWRKERTDKGTTRKNAKWIIDDEFYPKQGNGQPWSEIPFVFSGSRSNDSSVDESPMEAI